MATDPKPDEVEPTREAFVEDVARRLYPQWKSGSRGPVSFEDFKTGLAGELEGERLELLDSVRWEDVEPLLEGWDAQERGRTGGA